MSSLLARPGEEGCLLSPATVTRKPGRDTSVVAGAQFVPAQSDVTDMWPKPRIACVPLAPLCEMRAMPPRKPIAATGVRIVAPSECVAMPPTTRTTPLPNERTSSPFVVAGLKTKRSITSVELGPTLSVVLSMNSTWTLPVAGVWIFSLATTWVPISITRAGAPGGVPEVDVLTAPAVPTVSALAPADSARTALSEVAASSRGNDRVRRIFEFPRSEAEGRPRRDDEILQAVVRNGRVGAQILDLQREAEVAVERRVQGARHPPLSIRARDEGRDDRIRHGI